MDGVPLRSPRSPNLTPRCTTENGALHRSTDLLRAKIEAKTEVSHKQDLYLIFVAGVKRYLANFLVSPPELDDISDRHFDAFQKSRF